MIISLAVAEFIFSLICLITAYFISHSINGFIQSYVNSTLGDDTAKDAGLMTLNPFVHTDVFGLLALIFLGIGWLQTVPIDASAYTGRYRFLKLFVAYSTEALVSIIMAIIALFLAVTIYGYSLTHRLIYNFFFYYSKSFMIFFSPTHLHIADLFSNQYSSVAIVFAVILVSLVYLNTFIATISIIFNAFRYFLVIGFEKGHSYIEHADFIFFFGPFLVVIVFGDSLRIALLSLSEWGAYYIAHLFGV